MKTLAFSILAASLATPTFAEEALVLDEKVSREYRVYLRLEGSKAFAANGVGAYGYFYDAAAKEVAEKYALKSCEASADTLRKAADRAVPCQIIHSEEAPPTP
jgi:hypothetical protein